MTDNLKHTAAIRHHNTKNAKTRLHIDGMLSCLLLESMVYWSHYILVYNYIFRIIDNLK